MCNGARLKPRGPMDLTLPLLFAFAQSGAPAPPVARQFPEHTRGRGLRPPTDRRRVGAPLCPLNGAHCRSVGSPKASSNAWARRRKVPGAGPALPLRVPFAARAAAQLCHAWKPARGPVRWRAPLVIFARLPNRQINRCRWPCDRQRSSMTKDCRPLSNAVHAVK